MIQCQPFENVVGWERECSPLLTRYPQLFIRTALMSDSLIAAETDEQFLARFYRLHEAAVRVKLQSRFRNRQVVEDKLHDAQIKVLEYRAMLESKTAAEC